MALMPTYVRGCTCFRRLGGRNFHTDVRTATKFLDSEYIKDEHTEDHENEFRSVLRKVAKTPGHKFAIGQGE